MKNKLQMTKEKLQMFYLTEMLIYESYNNRKLISKEVSEKVAKKFCNFYNFDSNKKQYQAMYDFAEISVDYMEALSTITSMYYTFEQFLKVSLNFQKSDGSLEEKINDVCRNYEYNIEENSFYEIFEKYRMINNSIKHSSINYSLIKKYPKLINKNCDIKAYGTILDNPFNITDDDIIECYTGLCSFIGEMYTYFEDFGHI